MIFTLVIASLAVVLRIIRQTGGKERGKLGPHKADGTGPNSSHMSGQPKNLARHPSDILQQRFVWPFVASQIGIANFNRASSSDWIEFLALPFEIRLIRDYFTRVLQPCRPDRVVGATEHRYVLGMSKNSVALTPGANGRKSFW